MAAGRGAWPMLTLWWCASVAAASYGVFDDVLDPAVLRILHDRLLQHEGTIASVPGRRRTRWLSIGRDGSTPYPPRTPIERAIVAYAPIVLREFGSVLDELVGVDWWVQNRLPSDPKEYHADTDTLLCNEAQKRGERCRHAVVATVFYVQAGAGGPTVVFNQTFGATQMQPPIPSEVVLVPARTNRLLAFQGDLYHGVVHPPAQAAGQGARLTLLANFWTVVKTEESDEAPLVLPATDPNLLARMAHELDASAAHRSVLDAPCARATRVGLDFPFDHHMDDWQKQRVPAQVARRWETPGPAEPSQRQAAEPSSDGALASGGTGADCAADPPDGDGAAGVCGADGTHVGAGSEVGAPFRPIEVAYKPSSINAQLPPGATVPSWMQWK